MKETTNLRGRYFLPKAGRVIFNTDIIRKVKATIFLHLFTAGNITRQK